MVRVFKSLALVVAAVVLSSASASAQLININPLGLDLNPLGINYNPLGLDLDPLHIITPAPMPAPVMMKHNHHHHHMAKA